MTKVTYVEWIDSAGSSDNVWQHIDDLGVDTVTVESAGIVEFEDSESITLVGNRTAEGFMGDITIPKFAVINRRDLEIA